MPFQVTCVIGDDKSGEATVVAQFEDEEWARLTAFASEAERLQRSIAGTLAVNFTIRCAEPTGVAFETNQNMSEDALAILLHRLRPFVLQDESLYLMKVIGVIAHRVANETFRRVLDRRRRLFDGRNFQGMMCIRANDVILNSEKILLDWLNSEEYHRDQVKHEKIEALHLPRDLLGGTFQFLLVDKVRAILNVAHIIRVLERPADAPINAEPFSV